MPFFKLPNMVKTIKRKTRTKNDTKYTTKKSKTMPKAIICYCPQICPDVMRVQLPYVLSTSWAGGGSIQIQDRVYRANSIFDPDFAVGGGQPLGHDQWSAFYTQYRVYAIKVEVEAMSDAAIVGGIGIVTLNTSSGIVDRDQIREQQKSKELLLGTDTATAGKLSHYMTTAQQFGMPNDVVQYDDNLRSSFGSDPSKEYYVHVYGFGIGTGSTNFDVSGRIKLTYYVDLFNKSTLSRS